MLQALAPELRAARDGRSLLSRALVLLQLAAAAARLATLRLTGEGSTPAQTCRRMCRCRAACPLVVATRRCRCRCERMVMLVLTMMAARVMRQPPEVALPLPQCHALRLLLQLLRRPAQQAHHALHRGLLLRLLL